MPTRTPGTEPPRPAAAVVPAAVLALVAAFSMVSMACGGAGDSGGGEPEGQDPGAPERCDGADNDRDGLVDEGWDRDRDGWTPCAGDCRDSDGESHPGAAEVADGVDNDCDGVIDEDTDVADDDRDGWSEDQGDCNDDPGALGWYANPGAIEVQLDRHGQPEGMDNDCDGLVDEALEPCASGGDADDPWTYAHSLDACHATTHATWTGWGTDSRARAVRGHFGATYVPAAGPDFMVLATGIAGDREHPEFVDPPSTELTNQLPHPAPMGPTGCSGADPLVVNDYAGLELWLQVPSNARAFSFDFNFMSAEFPEWVCSSYDDTFLALLESAAYSGNISFDAQGNRVSINVGFFDVCAAAMAPACTGEGPLLGTGYEDEGGGTGWLTTTAPVVPGEKIRLRLAIFDEGDRRLDSLVLIDNFRWEVDVPACPDGTPPPCTIGRGSGSDPGPGSRFVYR